LGKARRQPDPTNGISLTHASAPAPARRRYLERSPAKPRLARTGDWRQKKHDDLIISLGEDEGLLNWKSSPHVMFLACCRAGVRFEIPE
jgi:hypothetical protein